MMRFTCWFLASTRLKRRSRETPASDQLQIMLVLFCVYEDWSEDTKSRSQLFFNSGSDRNSIKDEEQKWVPSDMTTSWQWQSENCFSSLLVLGWCVALSYWSGKCGSPLVGLLLAHTNVVTLLIHLLTKAGLRGTYKLLPDTLWPPKGCGSL